MSTSIMLLLLGLVSVIIGLVDAKCCLPKQWEGNMSYIEVHNTGNLTFGEATFALDAVNKLYASNVSIGSGKSRQQFQTLLDYYKHVSYVVLGGQCHENSLPGPYPSFCLPDSAKKVFESRYGAGNDTLHTVTYQIMEKATAVMTTFTKSCVPVLNITYGQQGNEKLLNTEEYTGIVLGITDRSVFNIPPACKKQSFIKEFAQIASPLRTRMKFPGF